MTMTTCRTSTAITRSATRTWPSSRPDRMNGDSHPPLRSFGRTKSRTIKPRQADLLATLLPKIALPDPALGPIDPLALMPDCGGGLAGDRVRRRRAHGGAGGEAAQRADPRRRALPERRRQRAPLCGRAGAGERATVYGRRAGRGCGAAGRQPRTASSSSSPTPGPRRGTTSGAWCRQRPSPSGRGC